MPYRERGRGGKKGKDGGKGGGKKGKDCGKGDGKGRDGNRDGPPLAAAATSSSWMGPSLAGQPQASPQAAAATSSSWMGPPLAGQHQASPQAAAATSSSWMDLSAGLHGVGHGPPGLHDAQQPPLAGPPGLHDAQQPVATPGWIEVNTFCYTCGKHIQFARPLAMEFEESARQQPNSELILICPGCHNRICDCCRDTGLSFAEAFHG